MHDWYCRDTMGAKLEAGEDPADEKQPCIAWRIKDEFDRVERERLRDRLQKELLREQMDEMHRSWCEDEGHLRRGARLCEAWAHRHHQKREL